ncbi:uncharacterized protein LOC115253733 [Aedes albopictus]|uniref:HTH psq-type domain-containing protein n=1 Tax=Aedes albopictus TaxID=7160 RepID=A0ABM1Y380_AEDAL
MSQAPMAWNSSNKWAGEHQKYVLNRAATFGPSPKEEHSNPTKSTEDIRVKEEPPDQTGNPVVASDLLELGEVKVEVCESPADCKPDPISALSEGLKPLEDLPAITLAELPEVTCQFCLAHFRDPEGRGLITRRRIEFVLGVGKWDASNEQLNCCQECKEMFDLFYEFKRSCLKVLALQADVRLDKDVTMNDHETEASILESTMAIPPSLDGNSDIVVDDRVRELTEMNPYRLDHPEKLLYHKSGNEDSTPAPFKGKRSDKGKTPKKHQKRNPVAEDVVQKALEEVKCGTLTYYAAALKYGIPRTTLQYRLSDVYKHKGSRGPYTVLTSAEEEEIVTWLKDKERKGHPITQHTIQSKVTSFLKAHPRVTPFKDDTPGR